MHCNLYWSTSQCGECHCCRLITMNTEVFSKGILGHKRIHYIYRRYWTDKPKQMSLLDAGSLKDMLYSWRSLQGSQFLHIVKNVPTRYRVSYIIRSSVACKLDLQNSANPVSWCAATLPFEHSSRESCTQWCQNECQCRLFRPTGWNR